MKARTITYWVATILVAFCMGSGGAAELLRVPGTVQGLVKLGYPTYFVSIIGFWKLLAAMALLFPRFPRLKEWAYAGIFFNMSGAAVSALATGAETWHVAVDVVLIGLNFASWALRPKNLVLEAPGSRVERARVQASPVLNAEPAR